MNTEDRLKELMRAARAESTATEAEWNAFIRRAHRPLYIHRAAAVLAAVALIAVGAFGASALTSDDPNPVPPSGGPTESPEPSPSQEPATVDVPLFEFELWAVQDERLSWGTAAMGGSIAADLASDDPVARKAAFALPSIFGHVPGPYEETGATTAIPEGTRLLGVSREGSVLNVDLNRRFESGGGSLSMQLRVAQVVYTGTQFEGIEAVRFLIEGERVDSIGGEGIVVSDALTRRDFQDLATSIVVETPKPGQEITSPVDVTGFANTFEATVNFRIVDENGNELIETFTTATCGTGCWGDFSEAVAFEVAERQEGRLVVFTYSAEDGSSERDVISLPVTLVP